jgi:hypothetical protein
MEAALSLLILPLFLLNFAGLVGGIWLLILGQWKIVVGDGLDSLLATLSLGIFLLPGAGKAMTMRVAIMCAAILLAACAAQPQPAPDYVDPLAVANSLLRRHVDDLAREDTERQQQQAQRLSYRRMSSPQLMGELSQYCPGGPPNCPQEPPEDLIQEAARRGLITPIPVQRRPLPPGMDCVSVGDEDMAITNCDVR